MLDGRDEQGRFEVAQAHLGGLAEKVLSGGVAQDALIESPRNAGGEESRWDGRVGGEAVEGRVNRDGPGASVLGLDQVAQGALQFFGVACKAGAEQKKGRRPFVVVNG